MGPVWICAMSECMLAEAERKGDQIEKEKHTLLGSFEYRVYERDDFLGTGGGRVFPPSAGACLARLGVTVTKRCGFSGTGVWRTVGWSCRGPLAVHGRREGGDRRHED